MPSLIPTQAKRTPTTRQYSPTLKYSITSCLLGIITLQNYKLHAYNAYRFLLSVFSTLNISSPLYLWFYYVWQTVTPQ